MHEDSPIKLWMCLEIIGYLTFAALVLRQLVQIQHQICLLEDSSAFHRSLNLSAPSAFFADHCSAPVTPEILTLPLRNVTS